MVAPKIPAVQSKAPPVYRPASAVAALKVPGLQSNAPPVYRPASAVIAPKPSTPETKAPPVYRPDTAVVVRKLPGPLTTALPVSKAPPVYRPISSRAVNGISGATHTGAWNSSVIMPKNPTKICGVPPHSQFSTRFPIGCAAVQRRAAVIQRKLSDEDEGIFREFVRKDFEAPIDDVKLIGVINSIVEKSNTLDGAKAKWGMMKGLFKAPEKPAYKNPPNTQPIADLVEPKDSPEDAIQECVTMDSDKYASSKNDKGYVLWTGGAADCIAIATYDGSMAWLKHATANEIVKQQDALIKEIMGNASAGKIYISSQKPQAAFEQALKLAGANYELFTTGRLAISAKSGKVLTSFAPPKASVELLRQTDEMSASFFKKKQVQ